MKCFILFAYIAGLFVTSAFCAVAYIPNAKHPDYPNQCYHEGQSKIIMNFGSKKRFSDGCGAYECNSDYTIRLESCGVIGGSFHPCRVIPGDVSKPYPMCCQEIVC